MNKMNKLIEFLENNSIYAIYHSNNKTYEIPDNLDVLKYNKNNFILEKNIKSDDFENGNITIYQADKINDITDNLYIFVYLSYDPEYGDCFSEQYILNYNQIDKLKKLL